MSHMTVDRVVADAADVLDYGVDEFLRLCDSAPRHSWRDATGYRQPAGNLAVPQVGRKGRSREQKRDNGD